jgi:hypothetical protein
VKTTVYQALRESPTYLGKDSYYTSKIILGTYDTQEKAKNKCNSDYRKINRRVVILEWFKDYETIVTKSENDTLYRITPLKIE